MLGLQKYSVGRVPLAIIHSIIADEHGAQQQCNSTSFILDYFSFFFLINQTVRVRRYTIWGNSHTVRTLPGYVLVCGGDGEGGILFFPVCGVIPTCCSILHSALFPHVYSFPTCAIYSLRTIHAIVPFMPSYHLCLAPSPHVLGPREVKDACVALPVI